MGFEKVKAYLESEGLKPLVFDESSATVELAAHVVGCEPCRIAKTMSFLVEGAPVLVVMAGDVRVDNAKFKAFFHQKASMIPFEQVSALTGFPVGGVCPFLAQSNTRVYLDESLKRFETVYPSAGSRNSAVEVNRVQLEKLSRACGWVDVTKPA